MYLPIWKKKCKNRQIAYFLFIINKNNIQKFRLCYNIKNYNN